jgi:hypothetical protein
MTRAWQMSMPPEGFAFALHLIEQTVGDGWPELAGSLADLAGVH